MSCIVLLLSAPKCFKNHTPTSWKDEKDVGIKPTRAAAQKSQPGSWPWAGKGGLFSWGNGQRETLHHLWAPTASMTLRPEPRGRWMEIHPTRIKLWFELKKKWDFQMFQVYKFNSFIADELPASRKVHSHVLFIYMVILVTWCHLCPLGRSSFSGASREILYHKSGWRGIAKVSITSEWLIMYRSSIGIHIWSL